MDEVSRLADRYGSRARAGPEEIEATLEELGAQLPRRVRAFDIGGAPMVLRGLKDGTKDIDLVFETTEDREEMARVLGEMGYSKTTSEPEYRGLEAYIMQKAGAVGFDLFVQRIMKKLVLSDGMKERADDPVRYGSLVVRHCANEDIFILKSVTHRPDDDQDLFLLLEAGLDPAVMRGELAGQVPRSDVLTWNEYVYRRLEEVEDRTGKEILIKAELFD